MSLKFILIPAAALFFSACASISTSPQKTQKKFPSVTLIGIDGATWKVINPMLDDGQLPNLKKLILSGVRARIDTIEEASPAIWTTIATGRNPKDHGIYAFLHDDIASKVVRPSSSLDRQTKAIWNILSEQGKRVGVFNYLISWPAEQVNGFIVADTYPHRKMNNHYHPPLVQDYMPPPSGTPAIMDTDTELDRYKSDTFTALRYEAAFSVNLIRSVPCEVFIVYTHKMDELQHVFWKFTEPEKFRGSMSELSETDIPLHSDTIKQGYREVDNWIGRLLQQAGEDTVIIVASDHGFKAMTPPHAQPLSFTRLVKRSRMKGKIRGVHLADYRMLTYISSDLPRKEVEAFINGIKTEHGQPLYTIVDSPKPGYMLAISHSTYFLRPDSKIMVDGQWHKVAALIPGSRSKISLNTTWDVSGDHDYSDGVFIMSGGPVKKNNRAEVKASIYDIAPTMLYLAGVPAAKDMPGRVLLDLFAAKYVKNHPPSRIETYEFGTPAPKSEGENKPRADDGALIEQLRAIGYLP